MFSFIGIIYYLKILIFEFDIIDYDDLILFYVIACLHSLLLITNIGLIINRSYISFSLLYNMIFYFTQFFHFNLLGLNYEFSSGTKAAIYFILHNGVFIEFKMQFFAMAFRFVYPTNSSSGLFFGVNLMSIALFLLYYFIYIRTCVKNQKTKE